MQCKTVVGSSHVGDDDHSVGSVIVLLDLQSFKIKCLCCWLYSHAKDYALLALWSQAACFHLIRYKINITTRVRMRY